MNRQIKFRVWDKKHKILVKYGEGIGYVGFIIYMDGKIIREIINSSFDGIDRNTTEEQDNYVIQQFTGLKDRNGKDIYEGDILKIHNKIELVQWVNASPVGIYDYSGWYTSTILLSQWKYSEIIGNIFEDEILK